MGDERETITVAELSSGPPGGDRPADPVELPVVEVLTGRAFVTGKSGSGKSNTASVVVESLLDGGYPVMIVDVDGEYYGLKEEYEILHAGADEECDVQVTAEHAGKLAGLALEENVPVILDVSSFLEESEARALLTAVAKQLFSRAKKQKQPFLLLVEEIHEYIPENGSVGECGRMLIKIGKRGRKHGLGIVGISQRPADVKKDFITQCDWLVWHRLTWDNDTTVVSRVLDAEYAEAVEDLDDGEAFLMTDWSESVRRVKFRRKRTFDAGATPGLEDFERPELKSVSDDLVSELAAIGEAAERREDRVAELREELDRKNSRIAELERELQDARDLSRMADQFVDALLERVEGANPGRTEQERARERRAPRVGAPGPGEEETGAEAAGSRVRNGHGDRGDGRGPSDRVTSPEDTVSGGAERGTDGDSSADPPLPGPVEQLRAAVAAMKPTTRKMLRYYRDQGPGRVTDAHAAAGGEGDRTAAYAHNRTLRTHGLVEHVGRGYYDSRLPPLVEEECDRGLGEDERRRFASAVDAAARDAGR